ncbi:MAG: hypothetical protein AB7K08_10210 [Microbacteriaceae bacterium]
MTRTLRAILIVLGSIALVAGAIFAGQGIGVIPGSFMTGDRTWLIVGLIMAFIGVALILFGTNRGKPRP